MIKKPLVGILLAILVTPGVYAQTAVTHEIIRTDTALVDVALNADGSVFATNTFSGIPLNSMVTAAAVSQTASGNTVSTAVKVEPYYEGEFATKNTVIAQSDFGTVVAPPASPPPPPMANGGTGQVPVVYNFYNPNTKALTGFGYVYFNYQNGVLVSISTTTVPYTAPPLANFCAPGNPGNNPDCPG
jgi:hypothetical protein